MKSCKIIYIKRLFFSNIKKNMTCIGGNPGPALEQAQTWVWVKSRNWIPTLPFLIMDLQRQYRLRQTY